MALPRLQTARDKNTLYLHSPILLADKREIKDSQNPPIGELFLSGGTVEFFSEIAKSLKFTAEHTENAKAPKILR
jgi:hypothetical protein